VPLHTGDEQCKIRQSQIRSSISAGQMYCECHQTLVFAFPTTARKMLPPAGSMPAPLQALASFFDNARRVWDNQWAELQQRAGPRPQGSPDQLVFHMMNPVQRRIVRMPRPFASLTAAGTDLPPLGSGGSQQGPPNLLRAAKGGSGTDGGASTHSAAEEKQERILISEVSWHLASSASPPRQPTAAHLLTAGLLISTTNMSLPCAQGQGQGLVKALNMPLCLPCRWRSLEQTQSWSR
jgi:hypothetical protein